MCEKTVCPIAIVSGGASARGKFRCILRGENKGPSESVPHWEFWEQTSSCLNLHMEQSQWISFYIAKLNMQKSPTQTRRNCACGRSLYLPKLNNGKWNTGEVISKITVVFLKSSVILFSKGHLLSPHYFSDASHLASYFPQLLPQ